MTIDYISGFCSVVTSSHLEYKFNSYTFLNIQNGENTPVKQSTRFSSDDLKRSYTFTSMNVIDPLIAFNTNIKIYRLSSQPLIRLKI